MVSLILKHSMILIYMQGATRVCPCVAMRKANLELIQSDSRRQNINLNILVYVILLVH